MTKKKIRGRIVLGLLLIGVLTITGASTVLALDDAIPHIKADLLHREGITGKGIGVCIIDTGIDTDNDNFGTNGDRIIGQKCFCSVSDWGSGGCCANNQDESNEAEDFNGHGTHVAGIATANDDVIGVAPEANIVAVKVCNATGISDRGAGVTNVPGINVTPPALEYEI